MKDSYSKNLHIFSLSPSPLITILTLIELTVKLIKTFPRYKL